MPKKAVEEKRVSLNTLIAPVTRQEISRRAKVTGKSQGIVVDEALAGNVVGCEHGAEIGVLRSELAAAEERAAIVAGLRDEARALIHAEAERLSEETGQPVSRADVVEMAIVKWCSVDEPTKIPGKNEGSEAEVEVAQNSIIDEGGKSGNGSDDKWAAAKAAMRAAEGGSAAVAPKVNKGAESVAQRRARETREHAAELAESDVTARLTGRTDIDYDLEHVPHRSVATMAVPTESAPAPRILREPKAVKRSFAPLVRPHGKTEAKRRREQ